MGQNSSRTVSEQEDIKKLVRSIVGNKSAANVFWAYLLSEPVSPFDFMGERSSSSTSTPKIHDEVGGVLRPRLVQKLDAFCSTINISRFSACLCGFGVLMERYGNTGEFWIHHNYGVTGSSNRQLRFPVTKFQLPEEGGEITFSELCHMQHELIQQSSYHLCIPRLPLADGTEDPDNFLGVFLLDRTSGHTEAIVFDGLSRCSLAVVLELLSDSHEIIVRLYFQESMVSKSAAMNIFNQFLYTLEQGLDAALVGDVRTLATVPEDQHEATVNYMNRDSCIDFPELRMSLPELILSRASRCAADQIAVRQYGPSPLSLTYQELLRESRKVAGELRKIFFKHFASHSSEPRVGILLNKGVNQIVAILGILMAGAVYVPLDPVNHPSDRIEFILQDSSAVCLVTETAVGPLAKSFSSKWPAVFMDKLEEGEGAFSEISHLASPEPLCYVIYTSGSTGRPKGVLVPQKGIVNDIFCVYQQYMQSSACIIENVLFSTNICFDAHVDEVFLPLVFGGSITALHCSIAEDRICDSWNVSFVQSTPSVFGVIEIPPSVRCVLIGGETLTRSCLERVSRGRSIVSEAKILTNRNSSKDYPLPPLLVINGYGPTETTNESSLHIVRSTADTKSIGRPIWNTQFYILDKAGKNLVPPGAWGELYIGGVGVTKGYLNLPQLTSSVFFHCGLRGVAGQVYKTGDLVRIDLKTGCLEFGGRKEAGAQVKLRGYRIELGEIQHAIMTENKQSVKECFVTIDKKAQQIVAYVVSDTDVWSVQCTSLPAYMQPRVLVRLSEMPRNISGKLDVKRLPPAVEQSSKRGTPERDPILAALVEIVCSPGLLNVDEAGVDGSTNFFQIGGNSLNLVTLHALLCVKFPNAKNIRLQTLLQAQTLGSMAGLIRQEAATGTTLSEAPTSCQSSIIPMGQGINSAVPSTIPFFCIHAAGGQVHTYSHMAALVSAVHPFYAIQDPCLTTGLSDKLNSFPAMGELYAEHIQKLYPAGVVVLGGHSSGGAIAYETAKFLRRKFGRKIACVLLMDTEVNLFAKGVVGAALKDDTSTVLSRLEDIGHNLYNGWREGLMSDYLNHLPGNGKKFWHAVKAIFPKRLTGGGMFQSSDLVQMIALLDHHLQIEKSFAFDSENGTADFDIIQFRPAGETNLLHEPDDMIHYDNLSTAPNTPRDNAQDIPVLTTGKITIVDVPNANHYNIIRPPSVDLLSAVVLATLEKAQLNIDH